MEESNYEMEKKYALEILNIALENDALEDYVFCFKGYEIYTHDSLGVKVPSIDLIMQSIYTKSKELPNLQNDFYNVLLNAAKNYKSGYYIIHLLNIIEYQYRQEKTGNIPFRINMEQILVALKNNVNMNREYFERKDEKVPNGYISLISQHDDIIENYFGSRVLWTDEELEQLEDNGDADS